MTTFDAVMTIEQPDEDTTEDTIIEAWQHLINSGVVWQLQGFYGRTAKTLIEQGICTMPSR